MFPSIVGGFLRPPAKRNCPRCGAAVDPADRSLSGACPRCGASLEGHSLGLEGPRAASGGTKQRSLIGRGAKGRAPTPSISGRSATPSPTRPAKEPAGNSLPVFADEPSMTPMPPAKPKPTVAKAAPPPPPNVTPAPVRTPRPSEVPTVILDDDDPAPTTPIPRSPSPIPPARTPNAALTSAVMPAVADFREEEPTHPYPDLVGADPEAIDEGLIEEITATEERPQPPEDDAFGDDATTAESLHIDPSGDSGRHEDEEAADEFTRNEGRSRILWMAVVGGSIGLVTLVAFVAIALLAANVLLANATPEVVEGGPRVAPATPAVDDHAPVEAPPTEVVPPSDLAVATVEHPEATAVEAATTATPVDSTVTAVDPPTVEDEPRPVETPEEPPKTTTKVATTTTKTQPAGGSYKTYVDKGWAKVESDPAGAASLFNQALRIRPGDSEASYGLGYAMLGQGSNNEARSHLCNALRNNPGIDVQREVSALLSRNGLSCE